MNSLRLCVSVVSFFYLTKLSQPQDEIRVHLCQSVATLVAHIDFRRVARYEYRA